MDYAKLLDLIIKAPLWLFFAALLVSGIPMLNLDVLTRAGVTSEIKILGMPLGFYALLSASLFGSSATARSYGTIKDSLCGSLDWLTWRRRLFALSNSSRALLAVTEEDSIEFFYYDQRNNAISMLQNKGILEADLISPSGMGWGKFRLTYQYKKAYSRHQRMFRSVLNYSHDASTPVRTIMQKAKAAATGRV